VTLPASVRLHVTSPSGPQVFTIPVTPASACSGTTVATLAARARIRELEEGQGGVVRGSQQRDRVRHKAATDAVQLALRYKLVSRGTSFVAVERRETPVTGQVALRRVPIALSAGWGGLAEEHHMAFAYRATMDSTAAYAIPSAASLGSMTDGRDSVVRRAFRRVRSAFTADGDEALSARDIGIPEMAARVAHAPVEPLQQLIALQRADGSWELDERLAAALGRDLAALEAALATLGPPEDAIETRRAWATTLSLAWLETHSPDREPEWQFLARKATRWLEANGPRGRDAAAWHAAAVRTLTA
jgi:hypothetical protein